MQINFDASRVAPSQPFVPLDAGWYNVKIIEQEQKPTKDNATTGNWYLKLTLEVVDGQFKGRKLFHNLNIGHQTSEDARRIAYEQLSAICHAVGRIQIQATTELNNLPMAAKVSQRTDPTGQYEPQNEVKGFKAMEQGGPAGLGGGAPAGFGGGPAATGPVQAFQGNQPAFTSAAPPAQAPAPAFQAQPPAAAPAPQQFAAAPAPDQGGGGPGGKAPWEV